MEPMKPMAPMAPMQPMVPITSDDTWWPQGLANPSSSGAQNDLQYAFFPEQQRLAIRQDGEVQQYDTATATVRRHVHEVAQRPDLFDPDFL